MTEVLAANGFFVYAGARSAEDMQRFDAMENVKAVRLDVTVQSDIDAAVAMIRSEGRGLYGLINNAGVVVVGPLIEMPERDMQFQLDVNLLGPYRVTKAAAPLIIESRGHVMNTSSISGIVSGPFLGAYSMSKHGIEAYTDALAVELARFDVAVAAVEPGNYRSGTAVAIGEVSGDERYSLDHVTAGASCVKLPAGGDEPDGQSGRNAGGDHRAITSECDNNSAPRRRSPSSGWRPWRVHGPAANVEPPASALPFSGSTSTPA